MEHITVKFFLKDYSEMSRIYDQCKNSLVISHNQIISLSKNSNTLETDVNQKQKIDELSIQNQKLEEDLQEKLRYSKSDKEEIAKLEIDKIKTKKFSCNIFLFLVKAQSENPQKH